MTGLTLTVSSIAMTMTSSIPDHRSNQRSGHSISIGLYPEDRTYLELKTGEVFCNPSYSKLRAKNGNTISATLSINEALADADYEYSKLRYFGETRSDDDFSPSSLHFQCFLPPKEFGDVLTNIRNGLLPSTVRIELEHEYLNKESPLTFGWEPDGSGLKWDNNNASARKNGINIEGITLQYELVKPTYDDETGELKASEQSSPTDVFNSRMKEVKDQLTVVRRDVLTFGRILIGGAVVIALMLFARH
jgi:hypothetical protein